MKRTGFIIGNSQVRILIVRRGYAHEEVVGFW